MDLFGNNSEDYTNDALQAEQEAYGQAQSYLQPFTQYGGQDFDAGRNALYGMIDQYGNLPNYNENFWKYLDMSPEDLLNQALSGYSESPFAQEETAFTESGINNKMIQEGMGGSGNNIAAEEEAANVIGNADMSRYLSDLMKSFTTQQSILKGYNQYGKNLSDMFGNLLGMEEGAGKQMSSNAMRLGQEEGESYNREASNQRYQQQNLLNNIMRLPGDIWELDKIFAAPPKAIGGK